MAVVDLDKIGTWPCQILHWFSDNENDLRNEKLADRAFNLLGTDHRLMNPRPSTETWKTAERLILNEMHGNHFRAFHATKLTESHSIMEEGLLPLSFDRAVQRVAIHLPTHLAYLLQNGLDEMLRAEGWFARREGAVWLTPLRRSLHDGGCDVLFENFGGEAMERIAGNGADELKAELQRLGEPKVVVCRIPEVSWCEFAELSLPRTMIELFLDHQGDWEPIDVGWDVMVNRTIPPENIEAIVSPTDDLVSC